MWITTHLKCVNLCPEPKSVSLFVTQWKCQSLGMHCLSWLFLYAAIVNHKRCRKTKANILLVGVALQAIWVIHMFVGLRAWNHVHWRYPDCLWNKSRIIPSLFPSVISSCFAIEGWSRCRIKYATKTEFWPSFAHEVCLYPDCLLKVFLRAFSL